MGFWLKNQTSSRTLADKQSRLRATKRLVFIKNVVVLAIPPLLVMNLRDSFQRAEMYRKYRALRVTNFVAICDRPEGE